MVLQTNLQFIPPNSLKKGPRALPQMIHVDMKFSNDIELLDGLFEFNVYINQLAAKVVTTTNTINCDIRQVQIQIHLDTKLDSFDLLIEILHELKYLYNHPRIEMMNIFLK